MKSNSIRNLGRNVFLCLFVATAIIGGSYNDSAAGELQKVKVGGIFIKSDFGAMPLPLAEDLGFFREEGLDVELINFKGGGALMTGFAAKAIFIAEAGGPSSSRGTSVGVPVTIISQLKPSLDNWGLMVFSDSPIKSLKDLKPGLKVGITRSGSSTHFVAILITAQAGLTSKDVTYVPLGSAANNLTALKKGEIDMISIYSPTSVKLEMEGKGKLVLDAAKVLPHFSNYVMSANPEFIDKNPEVVRKVLRAVYRATAWMKANPKKAIQRMQEMYDLESEIASELYRREINDFSDDGTINAEGLKFIIDASLEHGFFEKRPPIDKVYDSRFTPVSLK